VAEFITWGPLDEDGPDGAAMIHQLPTWREAIVSELAGALLEGRTPERPAGCPRKRWHRALRSTLRCLRRQGAPRRWPRSWHRVQADGQGGEVLLRVRQAQDRDRWERRQRELGNPYGWAGPARRERVAC